LMILENGHYVPYYDKVINKLSNEDKLMIKNYFARD
jgi:hypothetical protein